MTKRLIIFGSTGSIGVQTLEAVDALAPRWAVAGLTAGGQNVELLAAQVRRYRPEWVGIADEKAEGALRAALGDMRVQIVAGPDASATVARNVEADLAVAAIVGLAGLAPTVTALERGMDIALANKEVLVAAGTLVMELARQRGRHIIPIDSEHSALFQCMQGESASRLTRVILTASGGPFRGYSREQLQHVSVADALRHPNWNMGAKVTVDSATLMNKGLEVLEACHLFGLPPSQVDVVIHRESIVHSLVEFVDGSVKAQLGPPDMRLPIQYALTWPDRAPNTFARLDLTRLGRLHFELPDTETFPCLRLAYTAAEAGGTLPAVMNAANEVAVARFLAGKLAFTGISELVENVMQRHETAPIHSLDDVGQADAWARQTALAMLEG